MRADVELAIDADSGSRSMLTQPVRITRSRIRGEDAWKSPKSYVLVSFVNIDARNHFRLVFVNLKKENVPCLACTGDSCLRWRS